MRNEKQLNERERAKKTRGESNLELCQKILQFFSVARKRHVLELAVRLDRLERHEPLALVHLFHTRRSNVIVHPPINVHNVREMKRAPSQHHTQRLSLAPVHLAQQLGLLGPEPVFRQHRTHQLVVVALARSLQEQGRHSRVHVLEDSRVHSLQRRGSAKQRSSVTSIDKHLDHCDLHRGPECGRPKHLRVGQLAKTRPKVRRQLHFPLRKKRQPADDNLLPIAHLPPTPPCRPKEKAGTSRTGAAFFFSLLWGSFGCLHCAHVKQSAGRAAGMHSLPRGRQKRRVCRKRLPGPPGPLCLRGMLYGL